MDMKIPTASHVTSRDLEGRIGEDEDASVLARPMQRTLSGAQAVEQSMMNMTKIVSSKYRTPPEDLEGLSLCVSILQLSILQRLWPLVKESYICVENRHFPYSASKRHRIA